MNSAPLIALCFNCGAATGRTDLYNDWCLSCVMKWGHPDDAAELMKGTPSWSVESAVAFIANVAQKSIQPTPMTVAVQSFGVLDLSTDEKRGCGIVNIDRPNAVAGDGFLYDDGERSTGRMSTEVHRHFQIATTKLFCAGFPNRAISRVTGMATNTVSAWRRATGQVFLCECGDIATHQAWCWARFRASKKRQEFMARWHPSSAWTYREKDGFHVAYS